METTSRANMEPAPIEGQHVHTTALGSVTPLPRSRGCCLRGKFGLYHHELRLGADPWCRG